MGGAEWSRCRAWLLPALVDATEDEVVSALATGEAQLWPGERAALVTQLIRPDCLHVWLAGGDLAEILAMRPGLEAWGRAQGARAMTINGRRGWARVLARFGFEPDGEELRKAL